MTATAVIGCGQCDSRDAAGVPGKEPSRHGGGAPSPRNLLTVAIPEGARLVEFHSGTGVHGPSPRTSLFSERPGGIVFAAEREEGSIELFHNGLPVGQYQGVGQVEISPDGDRVAFAALRGKKWHVVNAGRLGPGFDEVASMLHSQAGQHLAYQGRRGKQWNLVVDDRVVRTAVSQFGQVDFSANGEWFVAMESRGGDSRSQLIVVDVPSGKASIVASGVSDVVVDRDRALIGAVATSKEGVRFMHLGFGQGDPTFGPEEKAIGTSCAGGGRPTFAYSAERSGRTVLVHGDQTFALDPGDEVMRCVVAKGGRNAGAIVRQGASTRMVRIGPGGAESTLPYEQVEGLACSPDGSSCAVAAMRGERWMAVIDGKEGPEFDRIVSPVYSEDGSWIVYRARLNGRRFVVVASADGRAHRHLSMHDEVHPVWMGHDGKTFAYGVRDGKELSWVSEQLPDTR